MLDTTTKSAKPTKHRHRDAILDILQTMPGLCCEEITALIEGNVPYGTISATLSGLEELGLLRSEKEAAPRAPGKHRRRLYSIRNEGEPATPPSNRRAETVTLASSEYERLREEVADLKAQLRAAAAWKADAIARHPDLAVDPLVLEARQIVAEQDDTTADVRDAVLAGRHDDSRMVRIVVETLRRARQA